MKGRFFMNSKKVTAFMLAAVIAATACGCGSRKSGKKTAPDEYGFRETGYPIVNKPITLKAAVKKNPLHGNWEDTYWYQYAREKTGIELEFDYIDKQSWEQKVQLMFASNELPDVIIGGYFGLTKIDEMSYGGEGFLQPLGELIDKYAPNIKKTFEDYPRAKLNVTAPDGNIYTLPKIAYSRDNVKRIWINHKWLENLGMEKPKTVEDMRKVLYAFRDNDPDKNGKKDTYAASGVFLESEADMRLLWMRAYGLLNDSFWVKNNKVVYTPYESNYKEYLKEMHFLYSEGLIDKSYFTQATTEFKSKSSSGKVGLGYYSAPGASGGMSNELAEEYSYVLPLTSSVNSVPIWDYISKENITGASGHFAITEANKYPEASIRWADIWYSEEGGIVNDIGPKRGAYKANTKLGYVIDENGEWEQNLAKEFPTDSWGAYNKYYAPAADGCNFGLQPALTDKKKNSKKGALYEMGEAMQQYGKNAYDNGIIQLPSFYFSKETQEKLAVIKTEVEAYAQKMEAKFITGEESLDKFESYIESLRQYKIDDLLSEYQKSYDEYKSRLN